MSRARRASAALLTFTVAGGAASAVFAPVLAETSFAVVFVCYAVVGWLITRSHPENVVGWLLLALGAMGGVSGTLWGWAAVAAAAGLPGRDIAVWSQTWLWAPMLGIAFGPLLLYFPNGRLLSPRWRFALWVSAAFVVVAGVGNALMPSTEGGGTNPYALQGHDAALRQATAVGGIALMVSLVAGVASLVLRFRRGGTTERRQLKWFLLAAMFLPVATVIGESNNQALQGIVIPAALALQAGAIGIAILRHGLYDIDRIISRTLSWGLITVVIGGVYLALITILSSTTSRVAGDSPFAVAAATLAAAGAFGPVRRRIQTAVDRRFNRARYDAAATVDALRTHLRDEVDLDTLTVELTNVVCATMQPAETTLWLREAER